MWRRKDALQNLNDDIEDHLAREIADNIARGLSPEEARRQALIAFGNVAVITERTRAVWRSSWFDEWRQDVRHAIRALQRAPGFAVVAVFTLALGIGANTAIVSLANGLIFRDLGVPNLDRLVALSPTKHPTSIGVFTLPPEDVRTIQDRHIPGIEHVFTSEPLIGALSTNGQVGHVSGELVSGEYFEGIGLRPIAGRLLTVDDDREYAGGAAIVISERLWARWFNRDPAAIGARARMAGYPLTIVGVVSREFRGTWLPTMLTNDVWAPRSATVRLRTVQGGVRDAAHLWHRPFARIAPNVSLAQLNGMLAAVPLQPGRTNEPDRVLTAVAATHAINFDDYVRPGLLIAGAIVALASLVFLIACANLTNLLLAYVTTRAGEVGIRLALGAGRCRVFRLLLVEVGVLTGLAAVVGMGLAVGLTELIAAFPIPEIQGQQLTFNPSPDWRVFTYAFAIAAVATFTVGLAPAWHASRTDPLRVINNAGRGAGSTRGRRLRAVLVGSQMAMSIVLVVLGGVYARSALKAVAFDPGYDIASTAVASVDFRLHGIEEAQGRQLYRAMLAAARAVPGVTAAALATEIPATGLTNRSSASVVAEGAVVEPPRPPERQPDGRILVRGGGIYARSAGVSPGFFQTLGIPLLRGRDLTDFDGAGAPAVAIISESLGKALWPGADPVGRRFRLRQDGPLLEVIGVAANVKTDVRTVGRDLFVYIPIEQDYSAQVLVAVRTAGIPTALVEPLRHAVRSVDPELAVNVQTVTDAVGLVLTPVRAAALVLGSLGLLGLGIALLGVYGVVAHVSAQRVREFGIRKALGATTMGIYAVMLRSSLWMVVLGVVPGLFVAFVAAGFLGNFVYGIDARDPLTFIAVPMVLITAGVAAAALAARRAARVEPHDALRSL